MRMAMLAILLWPVAAILYASGITLLVVLPVHGPRRRPASRCSTSGGSRRWPSASRPDKLSRVTSYDWMVSLGLLPLGYALAGPLAHALGAVEVMLGGSLLAIVAFALGLLPRQTRMLERLDREDAIAAEEEPLPPLLEHRL